MEPRWQADPFGCEKCVTVFIVEVASIEADRLNVNHDGVQKFAKNVSVVEMSLKMAL